MQAIVDNWQNIAAIAGAIGLVISEILPFIKNTNAQGVLHGLVLILGLIGRRGKDGK